MTDKVVANAGAGGSSFAVDSGVSASGGTAVVPYTKLMDGTLGSDAAIGGDATNGLDVDVTRVGGNVTVVQGTAANLKVDASGVAVPVTDNGGSLTIDGSLTTVTTVTTVTAVTAITNALPAGANAIGKLAANSGVDIGDVDVTSVVPGTGSTSLGKAVDTSYSAGDTGVLMITVRDDTLDARAAGENKFEVLHTDAAGALWVDPRGNVAHDAVDSGNPVKVGGKALTSLKTATLVASGDRIDATYDLDGAQMVRNGVPLGDVLNESKTLSTSAATNFSTFNASTGVKNCITSITVTNSHATTFGSLQLKDGSAGAAFWTLPAPASGGGHFTFDPPLKQTTAATALGVQLQPNVADVVICVNGYQSKA